MVAMEIVKIGERENLTPTFHSHLNLGKVTKFGANYRLQECNSNLTREKHVMIHSDRVGNAVCWFPESVKVFL